MKRTLAQHTGAAAGKKQREESDEDEPVLPTRAAGSSTHPAAGSTFADKVVSKPTAKLASIFQPRTANSSTDTNGASSSAAKLRWLDPIGTNKTCLHGVYGAPQPNSKVAFYDLDGTIVRPKNGKTFPSKTDEYDFDFLFSSPPRAGPSVIQRIRAQHEEGFAIVVITNQKQTAYSAKSGLATWKKKMGHIAAAIDVPMRVLAALGDDGYRKPRLGMWDEFVANWNGGVEIDLAQSFFVGDAAGRKKYRDHQDTDLKWALNARVGFYTPEEYFLAKAKEYEIPMRPWSPSALVAQRPSLKGLIAEPEDEMITVDLSSIDKDDTVARVLLGGEVDASRGAEIVLFVGAPASGKTYLFKRIFEPAGYAHVNQDTLRTRDKCLRVVSETIAADQSCVVDNTNRDRATRRYYIELARTLGVRIRCVYFDVPKHVCVHNNHFRAHHGPVSERDEKRSLLPYTAIESWFKERQPPTSDEGFDADVVRVKWGWKGDDEIRSRWSMYYH